MAPPSPENEETHGLAPPTVPPMEHPAPPEPAGVFSSGVTFYPPSKRLWRIGGKWYDFEPFLQLHPGGPEVIRLSRDRYEDSTFAFESHHHNYPRVRKMIEKYEVPAPSVLLPRPKGTEGFGEKEPTLLGDDAFYSVVRRRVTEHLKKVRCPRGEPTRECVVFFWANCAAFLASWCAMYYTGAFLWALVFGVTATVLGAFGHNWVHQPSYRLWAYLSLDTIGFSSTGWFREHVLQHHMYTNTPWDNHFRGTDPFLVTDPTVQRHWLQAKITPYINPLILTFGLYGNYIQHLIDTFKGCAASPLTPSPSPSHPPPTPLPPPPPAPSPLTPPTPHPPAGARSGGWPNSSSRSTSC